MIGWRKAIILVLSIVILSTQVIHASVKEQDVNDLLRLYNEAELNNLAKAEQAYYAALSEYNKLKSDVDMAEDYNKLLKDYKEFQESEKQELNNKIKSLLYRNSEVIKQIEDKVRGDFDILLGLQEQIRVNNEQINDLLLKKSKYMVASYKEVSYEQLDEAAKVVEESMKNYKEAVSITTLGVVDGVAYPLGKPSRVNSNFGERIDPLTGNTVAFHTGLDLYAVTGTEVLSIFNGIVVDTGWSDRVGYFVNVNHGNNVMSFYCHLSEILCDVGDYVNQYGVIALSGNTGTATTGAHLHFALYIDNKPVDPGVLFKR